ncbi:MAG TPA: hypothetical protein PKI77_02460 [Mycobacterium sp.]|nr:hypothetical protein [Mycobacterium sp.]
MQMFLVSGMAAAAVVSGCSSSVMNSGGDTTCKDFTAAEEKTQNETITKMIKDEGKNEPSNLELTGRRLAVQTYCQTVGSPDAKISQAPHL